MKSIHKTSIFNGFVLLHFSLYRQWFSRNIQNKFPTLSWHCYHSAVVVGTLAQMVRFTYYCTWAKFCGFTKAYICSHKRNGDTSITKQIRHIYTKTTGWFDIMSGGWVFYMSDVAGNLTHGDKSWRKKFNFRRFFQDFLRTTCMWYAQVSRKLKKVK